MRRYLIETGVISQAIQLTRETEFLCDTSTRQGSINMSFLYNNYGVIEMQHGDYTKSREWFEKTTELRRKQLGDTDMHTVYSKLNTGLVLLYDGKFTEALGLVELVEEVARRIPNTNDRLLSTFHDFRAIAYLNMGKLDEAWKELQLSIQMTNSRVKLYSQGSG